MGKLRLKELREDAELSQLQLGKAIGVDQRTISNYENEVSEPDIETIKNLCDFFKVTTDYFLGYSEI